ncbi:hypothetical protein M0R45_020269 [Rubus argutus]|uniref:Uncharacterized protein n=1 Tax=Rubus argutus TaxID=59490 RepID=A0AAW1XA86_RUBAR
MQVRAGIAGHGSSYRGGWRSCDCSGLVLGRRRGIAVTVHNQFKTTSSPCSDSNSSPPPPIIVSPITLGIPIQAITSQFRPPHFTISASSLLNHISSAKALLTGNHLCHRRQQLTNFAGIILSAVLLEPRPATPSQSRSTTVSLSATPHLLLHRAQPSSPRHKAAPQQLLPVLPRKDAAAAAINRHLRRAVAALRRALCPPRPYLLTSPHGLLSLFPSFSI